MKYLHRLMVLVLLTSLSACSLGSRSPAQGAAVGGAGGAAAGVATGALVGSAIANGDVAASALLGGAIGLPVGAALGYYYVSTRNDRESHRLDRTIDRNTQELAISHQELHELRQQVINESYAIEIDPTTREELYTGPTLGDSTR